MQGCILVQSVLTAMFSFVNVKIFFFTILFFVEYFAGDGAWKGGGWGWGLWLLFTGLLQEEALPLVYCVTVTVLVVEVIPAFTKLALPFFFSFLNWCCFIYPQS